nr:MAG TPA: hypothetical protein [Caudoviricetes sp.]
MGVLVRHPYNVIKNTFPGLVFLAPNWYNKNHG